MGMRVFVNQLPADQFPNWVGKQGPSYLMKLTGVNVSTGKTLGFQGVYIPLLPIVVREARSSLSFPLWRATRSAALILQETYPWIWFNTTGQTVIEDWEEIE